MQWWKWWEGLLVTHHATQTFPNGSPNKTQMPDTCLFRMDFAFPDFYSYGGKDLELVVWNTAKICQLHNYISSMFHRRNVSPNATTCPLRLHGLPPRLWLKCNRLLRLRRPVGVVMLSRWEWWWDERWIWGARGGLKPNFYKLPRPWSPWASSPFKEKCIW